MIIRNHGTNHMENLPCPACDQDVGPVKDNEVIHTCGAHLRRFVPIFFVQALPYGWRWEEVKSS